jgi:hypothetical protein
LWETCRLKSRKVGGTRRMPNAEVFNQKTCPKWLVLSHMAAEDPDQRATHSVYANNKIAPGADLRRQTTKAIPDAIRADAMSGIEYGWSCKCISPPKVKYCLTNRNYYTPFGT